MIYYIVCTVLIKQEHVLYFSFLNADDQLTRLFQLLCSGSCHTTTVQRTNPTQLRTIISESEDHRVVGLGIRNTHTFCTCAQLQVLGIAVEFRGMKMQQTI